VKQNTKTITVKPRYAVSANGQWFIGVATVNNKEYHGVTPRNDSRTKPNASEISAIKESLRQELAKDGIKNVHIE